MVIVILTIGLMILLLLVATASGPDRRDARIQRLSKKIKMHENHIASLKRELADPAAHKADRQTSAPCD